MTPEIAHRRKTDGAGAAPERTCEWCRHSFDAGDVYERPTDPDTWRCPSCRLWNRDDLTTDGGTELAPGAFAMDVGGDEASRVLVVRTPEITAGEYVVPGTGKTVADYNDCPEGEAVLEVVFVESLNKVLETWTPEEIVETVNAGEIYERGLWTYAYPLSRLRPVGEEAER